MTSCRDTEPQKEVVREREIIREKEVKVKDDKVKVEEKREGIIERTGKKIDEKVNKEIDKKIEEIGDDN